MRILVMGAGALGSLVGGYLTQAGHDVVLVGRDKHVQAIQNHGLIIRNSSESVVKPKATSSADRVKGPVDLILLTVKAYDTPQAAREVQHLRGGQTAVVCLQNGLDVEELASTRVERPLRGVTSHGALLSEPGVVHHTGTGDTIIGELDGSVTERVQAIAAAFSAAGLKTRITTNVKGEVWTKTLVNSGINPFGALTGMRNGELIQVPALKGSIIKTVEEGVTVADNLGIRLEADPVALTLTTAELTANNQNSMLQDILKQRRTEIDFINGAIAAYGRKCHVPTPLNEVLTGLIQALEQRNLSRGD